MSSWGQSWGSQQGYNGWSWHHGSWDKRGNGMHGDKWWKCKNCAADNKSKTACAICGLRRSYADAAKQAVDQSPKKRSGRQAGKPLSSTPGGSGIQACSGSCRKGLSPTYGCADERVGLQNWQAKLAKVEAALRAMPEDDEDLANERNAITAKIAETKAGMAENKPIGARIDAARRRLTRAQQRAKEAAAALEMAQRVVEDQTWRSRRRGIRRGDRMYRMRVARFRRCACTRPRGASKDLYGQHRRRSQCTVTTAPEHPQRGPGSGPQPCVSSYGSLCTAHRRVSTCLPRKWNDSEVFKQTRRGGYVGSNLRKCTHLGHVCQSERGQSNDELERQESQNAKRFRIDQ